MRTTLGWRDANATTIDGLDSRITTLEGDVGDATSIRSKPITTDAATNEDILKFDGSTWQLVATPDVLTSASSINVAAPSLLVDTINEKTTNNGVDIEGVHCEDSDLNAGTITATTQLKTNTINEESVGVGVVIDSVKMINGGIEASDTITSLGTSLVSNPMLDMSAGGGASSYRRCLLDYYGTDVRLRGRNWSNTYAGNLYLGNHTSEMGGSGAGTRVRTLQPLTVMVSDASTSTTTGALVVSGGTGIAGALNVGGNIESSLYMTANSGVITDGISERSSGLGTSINGLNIKLSAGDLFVSQTASSAALNINNDGTGAIKVNNNGASSFEFAVSKNTSAKWLDITDTTAATSSTTGALTVAGGVGIVGDLHVGGSVETTELSFDGTNTLSTLVNPTTWTVGATATTNLTGTPSYTDIRYSRVGDHVVGGCYITGFTETNPNATTVMTFNLPVATAINQGGIGGSGLFITGHGWHTGNTVISGGAASVRWHSQTTGGAITVYLGFSYTV